MKIPFLLKVDWPQGHNSGFFDYYRFVSLKEFDYYYS